ncbi:tellurite resistance TerB family protein [Massilia sp. DD77]|uniref:tellurite resistance TerB family protein n=1 Tax=Massilia sp. DD77 TaxID=3109349 RepID=UPI002FFF39A4
MRTYATNSHKAICRLLALAMIIDGRLAPQELKALHHSGLLRRLEVSEDSFDETAGELCQDLLAGAGGREDGDVELDPETIDRLLAEVDAPLLRVLVLQGMLDIVRADKVIDHRERRLLRRATHAWMPALEPAGS